MTRTTPIFGFVNREGTGCFLTSGNLVCVRRLSRSRVLRVLLYWCPLCTRTVLLRVPRVVGCPLSLVQVPCSGLWSEFGVDFEYDRHLNDTQLFSGECI